MFFLKRDLTSDIKKAKIKGHYRKLPNGKIIFIHEYHDKRKDAKKDPHEYRRESVHADDESTSVVQDKEGKEQVVTHKHKPGTELNQYDIHSHLRKLIPVDMHLAKKLLRAKLEFFGQKDFHSLYKKMVADNKEEANAGGYEQHIKTIDDAKRIFEKNTVKPYMEKLQEEYGHSTTLADAYSHDKDAEENDKHFENYGKYASSDDNGDPHGDYHDVAEHKMAMEHSGSAIAEREQEKKLVAESLTKGPKDLPKVPSLAAGLKVFGHQAEVLAKLDVLQNAMVDVDMGGGKGLLLPLDAINLMAKGKVKRPIIIGPNNTLLQNSRKIHEYTDGKFNVFMISNEVIKNQYDGDVQKLVEDINNAPPNTIFMATYGVFAYPDTQHYKDSSIPEEKRIQYGRSFELSAAGFDYCAWDEAHKTKDVSTSTHQAMRHLTGAKYKRMATGTLLSNDPFDVLGPMRLLDPSFNLSKKQFGAQFGFKENKQGKIWDDQALETLREKLIYEHGMISIRRSGWLHKLPKRLEQQHKLEATPKVALANESAIADTMDLVNELSQENPEIMQQLDNISDDGDDDVEEVGIVGQILEALRGINDFPHEMAERMENGIAVRKKYESLIQKEFQERKQNYHRYLETRKKQRSKKVIDTSEAKILMSSVDSVIKENDISQEDAAAMRYTVYFKPTTQKAIANMKGEVSVKAKHTYDLIRNHIKDPKNGKIMVFAERVSSVDHIFNNMPEDLKKQAIYYSGEKRTGLAGFLREDGPKIMIACDPSLTEGVNMQAANGLVRYDLPYTSGKAEQTYGRIWRFGQKRDCNIHIPVVDKSVDVIKYCRLMSKMKTNYKVSSGYDLSPNVTAYKLSSDNIRKNRDFDSLVPEYQTIQSEIMEQETEANKELQKRYGSEMLDPKSGKDFPNSASPPAEHGAYFSDGTSFQGDDREAIDYMLGQHGVDASRDLKSKLREDVSELYHHLEENKKKLKHSKFGEVENNDVAESFWKKYEKDSEQTYSDRHRQVVNGVVALLTQNEAMEDKPPKDKKPKESKPVASEKVQKTPPVSGKFDDHESALNSHLKKIGKEDLPKKNRKILLDDLKDFKAHMSGKMFDKKHLDAYWKDWEKSAGEPPSKGHRDAIESMYHGTKHLNDKVKKAFLFYVRFQ